MGIPKTNTLEVSRSVPLEKLKCYHREKWMKEKESGWIEKLMSSVMTNQIVILLSEYVDFYDY